MNDNQFKATIGEEDVISLIKNSPEFCPDEPETLEYESLLDEIRREMNQSL